MLPEDRFDALYHVYDGGGVEVTGPSLLLRKLVGENTSLTANYYVDAISSASIDVVSSASPYRERRVEKSLGVDYLHDKTIFSLSYTNSDENDYSARTAHFGISQGLFGDLTTVRMGYSRGWDAVGRRGDGTFAEEIVRQNYRLGLSQVLTEDLLLDVGFEAITDQGYLNNPYRSVRYVDSVSARGYSFEPEVYPGTRTSTALALRALYYLPYRAALKGEYRYFADTWGIDAMHWEVGYTHPWRERWIFDARYRYYMQDHADFYSDLFPRLGAQNYLARDKELSTFTSHTVGFGVSYEFTPQEWRYIDKGSLNLYYDYMRFDYENFRDLRVSGVGAGEEPLYDLSAHVLRLYLSLWY